jgi:hypothetical protein
MINKSLYDNYPKPISDFFDLYDCIEPFDNLILSKLDLVLDDFRNYITKEYNRLYPKGKKLQTDYILQQIFSANESSIGESQFIKIHLTTIIIQFENHILINYSEIKDGIHSNQFDSTSLKQNFLFLYYFFDDFVQFYANHYNVFHKDQSTIVLMRTMEPFSSDDTIYLSEQIMNGKLDGFEYFSIHKVIPSSIALIRTTIELILKNSLGINQITNSNGSPIKISSYIFLDFYKENKDRINFPVDHSVIQKIYEWSNHFIHAGEISYYWMIWLAHSTISKFFPFVGNEIFLITWDQEMYENRETILKLFLTERIGLKLNDIEIDLNHKMEHITIK